MIEKGFSKEISVKGDVIGGSGRKVDFDIAKRTDIDLTGELYGYGIMPDFDAAAAAADGADVHNADDYYYDGAVLTIDNGSINVSASSSAAPAGNIAVNTSNQLLGAFTVDIKGEAISVGKIGFNVTMALSSVASADDVDDITNVTIVDANGSVVAGPVDGTAADSSDTGGSATGSVVFTDSITFPVGLMGKIGTDVDNNTTIQASTTPSSDFKTVRGLTTGKTITPAPTSAITLSQMTLKSGAFTVSNLAQPPAQTIIAGSNNVEFARYSLSASESGEDIRVTTLPLDYSTNGTATDLTSCQLRDGSKTGTSLTTGSNAKDPNAVSSTTTFTFDGTGLIVPKGTTKTLSLTCNLKEGTADKTYQWGLVATANNGTYTGATGLASAQTIVETFTLGAGQVMTAASGGAYTVTADTGTAYNYRVVRAGTADVPLAAFRFEADLTEELKVKQIALQLGNVASNSPADLVNRKVSLWVDGASIGTAEFGADGDYATSTLTSDVALGKGPVGAKIVVVKGTLRSHDANTNTASTANNGGYGAFLAITYDGSNRTAPNGNYALGVGNVNGHATDVTTNGVRVLGNVPTLTVANLGSNTLTTGNAVYKFTVTNPGAQDIVFYKMSFGISTSGPSGFRVNDFELRGAGVLAVAAADAVDVETAGIALDAVQVVFDANEARRVPAGGTKEYILTATVNNPTTGTNSLNVRLLNDTAYPSLQFLLGKATDIDVSTASSTNNIIWTPFSTTSPTTAVTADTRLDWTNSYGLPIYDKDGTLVNPTGTLTIQASSVSI